VIILVALPLFLLIKWLVDRGIQNFGLQTSVMPSVFGIAAILLISWGIVFANYHRVKSALNQWV